jgi:CRISPR-associated protein Csx16
MTTYVITRHDGALNWIQSQIPVDVVLSHLEKDTPLIAGDCVVGLLPAHIAADLCAKGIRYFHLALDLPAHLRGVELTSEQMDSCGARLLELYIKHLNRI